LNNLSIGTDIDRAIEVIRNGGLVGFPTETVYGLSADYSNVNALNKIFAVKGRPNNHPLIVHVGSIEFARTCSSEWTVSAETLGNSYWPGPLTVVVKKTLGVADVVTGGHSTVALRVPGHVMALELLNRMNGGLAAPSANKFGRVSPTTAQHVWDDLGTSVDYILDGGPCVVGIESTIVDCSIPTPVVLRPGGISTEDIQTVIAIGLEDTGVSRAPGMLPAHYAPNCQVILVDTIAEANQLLVNRKSNSTRVLDASTEPVTFASTMYAQLRQCDVDGVQFLVVVQPSPLGIGLAIRDRLTKAAHGLKNQSH
jgi:L-threonylcarbamoyladenylate synthase